MAFESIEFDQWDRRQAAYAAHRMHALRTQGTIQRCQAPRSARPPRQHEQVGVKPQRRLPETDCRSPARALRPDLSRSSEDAVTFLLGFYSHAVLIRRTDCA